MQKKKFFEENFSFDLLKMGCVFSSEQDERKTKQNRGRSLPSQQQQQQIRQKQQQQQQQQQQRVNGSNGHSRTQQPVPVEKGLEPKTPTRTKTPSPTGIFMCDKLVWKKFRQKLLHLFVSYLFFEFENRNTLLSSKPIV